MRLDELLWDIGVLPPNPFNRSMAATASADVLLETMAQGPHPCKEPAQAWHASRRGNSNEFLQERPVAMCPYACHPDRNDQPVAQGSRSGICQRTMGKHSLSGHGPISSGNRPVRTRMRGGVGAGGENLPATRFAVFIL